MKIAQLPGGIRLVVLAWFIIWGGCLQARADETDSLRRAALSAGDIRAKADMLLQLGNIFSASNADSALRYYGLARELYSRIDYREGIADATYRPIILFRQNYAYDSAEYYTLQFLELSRAMHDRNREAKGLHQMGNIRKETDLYEESLEYHRQSHELFALTKDTNGLISNFNGLANVFKAMSAFDSAAAYYLKGIRLCEQTGQELKASVIYSNLGDIYLESNQFDFARKYYTLSYDINVKNEGRKASLAINFLDLGRVAVHEGKYEEAVDYYERSREVSEMIGDSLGVLYIYTNLGDLYFRQEKWKESIRYSEIALQGYRGMNYLKGIAITYGNLAAAMAEMGNYREAAVMQDSVLVLSKKLGNKDQIMDAYKNLADVYSKVGDYQKAFGYQSLQYSMKDSIYNLNNTQVINDLLLKYEKEKDEAQILALESENLRKTIQRNGVIYGSLGLLLLAAFGYFFARQRIRHHKALAQEKIQRLEEEKKLMTAKVLLEGQEEERKRIARELHDGLGVLLSATKMQFTTIKNISPENGHIIDKATELLEQATGDVRKISHNMMPGLLTKLGLYEAVEDLFENLNDSGSIHAVFELTGENIRLPENKEIMLYRVIQEMVNNTLKHAEAGEIKLIINVVPERMDLIYYDNGKGFDTIRVFQEESETLGLKSIRSRVGFLGGEVDIDARPGAGTRFRIQVPIEG